MNFTDKQSKTEYAYNEIKRNIINGELKANSNINELRICETLNISRTPARQALLKLINEGFIDFIQNKGMYISEIRLSDIIEIYDIRSVLDPFAIEICLEFYSPKIVKSLEMAIENQEKAYKEGNYKDYLKYDLEFHKTYINESRNKKLQQFMNTIYDQVERISNTTIGDSERAQISISHHRKIFEMFVLRDSQKLNEMVREHMQGIKAYYINKLYNT